MRELKVERMREMTEDDIVTKIRELKEELFHLRFRNTMRQLQNPLLLREKKRDVARLETILNEHRTGIRALVMGPGTAPAVAAPSKGAGAAAPARPAAKAKTKAKAAAKAKAVAKRVSEPAAKRGSKSATSKKKGKKA